MTARPTILAVDDQTVNLDILREALKADYRILTAKSGQEALRVAAAEGPDLILLDVVMPGLSGLETCQALKAGETTRGIPVIFVTAQGNPEDEELGFQAGAVDYIHKPVHPHIVRVRVKIHLQLADQKRALEDLVAERTREILSIQHEVVNRLSIASEYKDNETGLHIQRIGRYALVLARALGVPPSSWDEYRDAASLHDIGKIGIPDAILLKPGRLNDAEWEIMKSHTVIGARMLANLPQNLFRLSASSALSHHERWDGNGYPQGLAGKAIPLIGRIVAVCDVFDALLSDRPYKRAWPLQDTLDEITRGRGTRFDPDVVTAFFACEEALVAISRDR